MAEQFIKPVFDFLGFYLLKCNYQRNEKSGNPKKLFILVKKIELNDNVADMTVSIDLTFNDQSVSNFEYLSKFVINDMDWYNKNKEKDNIHVANFFAIAFPYMRTSISSVTNDSLGGIFLPVVNIINGDLTKGISFISRKPSN